MNPKYLGMAAFAAFLFLKANSARAMSDAVEAGIIDTPDNEATTPAPSEWDTDTPIGDLDMSNPQTMSDDGLQALKQREGGFQSRKYPDASGYSIGYGHFILPGENFDAGIDQATADELLRNDVAWAQQAVADHVTASITQNMFDALTSFTYNAGKTAFINSTLLKLVNAGDFTAAAREFEKWIYKHVGGVKVVDNGLINRRDGEAEQFAG